MKFLITLVSLVSVATVVSLFTLIIYSSATTSVNEPKIVELNKEPVYEKVSPEVKIITNEYDKDKSKLNLQIVVTNANQNPVQYAHFCYGTNSVPYMGYLEFYPDVLEYNELYIDGQATLSLEVPISNDSELMWYYISIKNMNYTTSTGIYEYKNGYIKEGGVLSIIKIFTVYIIGVGIFGVILAFILGKTFKNK